MTTGGWRQQQGTAHRPLSSRGSSGGAGYVQGLQHMQRRWPSRPLDKKTMEKARSLELELAASNALGHSHSARRVCAPRIGLQSAQGGPAVLGTGPTDLPAARRGPCPRWRGRSRVLWAPARGGREGPSPSPGLQVCDAGWGGWARGQCRPCLTQFLMAHFCPEHRCITSRSPKLASLDISTSRHLPVSRLTMGPLCRAGKPSQHGCLGAVVRASGSEGCTPHVVTHSHLRLGLSAPTFLCPPTSPASVILPTCPAPWGLRSNHDNRVQGP